MKLTPVIPIKPAFYFTCVSCGERKLAEKEADCFADLHGKPFEAYYCLKCAGKILLPPEQYQKIMNSEPPRASLTPLVYASYLDKLWNKP